MSATTDQIDVWACASTVLAALTDLQGYVSAAVNPTLLALADLKMGPMGWTQHVYSKTAFDTWRAELKKFPDDPSILHHMAIMHHARAFDLEAGPKPLEADADWEAAMVHWQRLHRMDVFWDSLTAKAGQKRGQQDLIEIQKLRSEFPQIILAIHYDIALDAETREKRKARSKFHIGMIQKAPFGQRERAEAQRAAYNKYIKAVPDEIWQPNELREDVLDKGQKAIVEYLNFDPDCIPALEDALRLQRRVQRSRNTLWRSLDERDPKRLSILQLEKKDADAWRPFFDQLVAVVDQLDGDVREDLARWYRGRGGDLCALDQNEKAIVFYQQAVGACGPDSDERKGHVRELVQTMSVVAREKAAQKDPKARGYCDKVRGRDDLTIISCWLLAQAYVQMADFDVAVAVCDRGLAIEPDFDDLEADEWLKRLTKFTREIAVLRLLSAARQAMETGKPQDALRQLNEAATIAEQGGVLREHNSIYWLRVQAYLAVDRIAEAKRDVELFMRLLDDKSSPADIEAGKKLREMVAAKENVSNVKPLLEKARKAMEDGRFQDALPPLDDAVRKAPTMDVVFFLRAQALCAVGRIADAKRDVRSVADLAESDDDRQRVKALDEMIDQAEAASVVKALLTKARQAMEAGRFKDALAPLNEAAKKAPRSNSVFYLRAQAHLGAGNVADARRDVKTVTDLAETEEDINAAVKLEEAINRGASKAAINGLLARAKSAMESQSFSLALEPLDEAAQLAPNEFVIYFMRAQARMASQNFMGAMQDLNKCTELAGSSEEIEAVKRLKKALFGGP